MCGIELHLHIFCVKTKGHQSYCPPNFRRWAIIEAFPIASTSTVTITMSITLFSFILALLSFNSLVLVLALKHLNHVSTKSGSSKANRHLVSNGIAVICKLLRITTDKFTLPHKYLSLYSVSCPYANDLTLTFTYHYSNTCSFIASLCPCETCSIIYLLELVKDIYCCFLLFQCIL